MAACRDSSSPTTTVGLKDAHLPATTRIVSLNGTVSEILVGLGLEQNIVGVDVTSTYPESLQRKAKVGHNRTISPEGVLALQPTLVIGLTQDVKPALVEQFRSAGARVLLFDQEHSAEGAKKLIRQVGDSLHRQAQADTLVLRLETDLGKAPSAPAPKPKVLFIYARGTGTMMVAGGGTQVEKVVELAGGQNAVQGFRDFKPLTPEALVQANPDVILLFDSGLKSLGGENGLWAVQGMNQTTAGKNRKVIAMEGALLTGFGPRLGQAVSQLAQNLRK